MRRFDEAMMKQSGTFKPVLISVCRVVTLCVVCCCPARAAGLNNLLEDPGFEALSTATSPDPGGQPWAAVEDDGYAIRRRDLSRSGQYAAAFQWYSPTGYISQKTGWQIEAGIDYDISAWMMIDEASSDPAHSNAAMITVTLAVADTEDGVYDWIGLGRDGLAPDAVGEWRKFTNHLRAEDLEAHIGKWVEIRFVKDNGNSQHRIFIDDASFGPSDLSISSERPGGSSIFLDIDDSSEVRGIIRTNDTGTFWANRRALGQSFRLEHPSSYIKVDRVTFKLGRDLLFDDNQHEMQIAFMEDTNGSGVGDTLAGPVFAFDMAGISASQNDYMGFELSTPVAVKTATDYSVEIWYGNADPTHTQENLVDPAYTAANFQIYRSSTNVYSGGGFLEAQADVIGTNFPFGEALSELTKDMNLMLHGSLPHGLLFSFLAAPRFKDVTEDVALSLEAADYRNACWIDFNQDGWEDLVAHGYIWINSSGQQFSKSVTNNVVGRAVAADYDNDGWPDLFSWSQLKMYRNLGGAGIQEITLPDFPDGYISDGASWGDFNNDGLIDLYVGGYETADASSAFSDLALLNQGDGTFIQTVMETEYHARGVTSCDFDQDGDMDVYVSDYRLLPNRLWVNNGSGVLSDLASTYNVTSTERSWSGGHSIGACWGDFDSDGLIDLFSGNFSHRGDPSYWGNDGIQPESDFFQNLGDGGSFHFQDKGTCGVYWQESYASPAAGDYNNDGLLDLFLTTVYSTATSGEANYPVLFKNSGSFSFEEEEYSGLEYLPSTYQAAWGDFDNDGMLDLLTASKLFKNQGRGRSWIKVKLNGDGVNVNRSAIGAQVRISVNSMTQTRQVEAGTGHGNQNPFTLHFGLDDYQQPVDLEILWPDGTTQTVTNVPINQTTVIDYSGV
jgi:hypothetical protein